LALAAAEAPPATPPTTTTRLPMGGIVPQDPWARCPRMMEAWPPGVIPLGIG